MIGLINQRENKKNTKVIFKIFKFSSQIHTDPAMAKMNQPN